VDHTVRYFGVLAPLKLKNDAPQVAGGAAGGGGGTVIRTVAVAEDPPESTVR